MQRLADDLDAPGALAVVDRWAAAISAEQVRAGSLPTGRAVPADAADGTLVRDAVDALLGVAL